LKKRSAQSPLVGGQNSRIAPQLLQAPQVTAATNLYRARTAEWAKRFGFHYLAAKYVLRGGTASANTPQKARALGGRAGNPVMLDKARWWEYQPSVTGWQEISRAFAEDVDTRQVTHDLNIIPGFDGFSRALNCDAASGGGYTCIVWESSIQLTNVAIISEATGQLVLSEMGVNGKRPKVVHSENHFSVFGMTENGGGTPSVISCTRYSTNGTNGPTRVSLNTSVVTDAMSTSVGNPWFDVQLRSTGNVLVAYRSSAPSVKAIEWDPTTNTASIAAATVVAGDLASAALGWVYNAADVGGTLRLLTAVNGATGVVERELNGATLVQSASTTILASPGDVASITGYRNGTDTYALWELRNADTTLTSVVEGHTTGPTNKPFMGIGCLQSKPFQVDGAGWYVTVSHPWDLQPGYYVVPIRATASATDRAPAGVAAAILPGAGVSLPETRNSLSHVPGVAASTTRFAMPVLRIYDFYSSATVLNLLRRPAIATLDFDGTCPKPVSYSRTMVAPGSVCRSWAGDLIGHCGFLLPPEKATATVIAGAGMGTGVYRWKACWTVQDGEGRTSRSASSPEVIATTTGGNNQVTVVVKQNFLNAYFSIKNGKDAKVEFYRTKVNGTQFFRLPSTAALITMDSSAQTLSVTDAVTDADLETNVPLYTDGGELFNEAPGPCIAMAAVGLRLVGIPTEDRTSVIASKEIMPGFGAGWHPDLRVPVVSDGDNYAVAAMENRTIVFKRQAIYILTGDWPNALGQGSLPIAQRVAKGFGTVEPESVCESQDGVWFKDPSKGKCLLTRGLDVVQLGKPVQGSDGSNVVGVEAAEDDEQVRVHTSGSTVLVYDHLEKQWSTWSMGGGTPSCTAVVGGVYYFGTTDGRVGFYNTASFQDNLGGLGDYEALLELRFDLAGKEGVQRLYRLHLLGARQADVTLLGRFSNDYGVGTEKAGLVSTNTNGTFIAEFRPEVQRATTHVFRARFTSSDEGLRFAAIALEYGLRDQPGLRRLPPGSIQ
jgi:hypothetical protein